MIQTYSSPKLYLVMTPQTIEQLLNITLTQQNDLDLLMKYDFPNTYALNEEGHIIGLNLRGNALTDEKMGFLHQLTQLEGLNLGENDLEQLNITDAWENLRFLKLGENKLKEVKFETALPKLEKLDVQLCSLQNLHFPKGFENLKTLYLQKNELEQISFESALPALEFLDLSKNALEKLDLPPGFDQLKYLYLNENKISNFQTAELPVLDTLNLEDNKLKELTEGFLDFFPNLLSFYLKKNSLSVVWMGEIVETDKNSLEVVRRLFREFAKGVEKDNECKILLIGNGNVGKTCLVKRLETGQFEKEWKSTHAISLFQYKKHKPYILNFWDFAGQDIYHSTHRLFMQTDAVYLCMWDKHTEATEFTTKNENGIKREYLNRKLPYWLSYAVNLGNGSPIIVVQTKVGHDGEHIEDRPEVRDRFGKHILDFCHIESEDDDWDENGYHSLFSNIRKAIKRTKKKDIPKGYYELREFCRQEQAAGKKELSLQKYLDFAKDRVEEPLKALNNWLVKTGVVFYQKGLFKDLIILDQERAINAVYTIFDRNGLYYDEGVKNKGHLNGADLARIWKEEGYELPEWELFLSFMLSCELCFEETEKKEDGSSVPFEERKFIAPQLLPDKKPDSIDDIWLDREAIYLKYHHDFLHYGILQSFIIKTRHLAEPRHIWKLGVALRENKQLALVEIIDEQEILVRVTPNGKHLMDKIRNLLEELQDDQGEEKVSLNGDYFVSLDSLLEDSPNNREIKADNGHWIKKEPLLAIFQHKNEQATFVGDLKKEVEEFLKQDELRKALERLEEAGPQQIREELPQHFARLTYLEKYEAKGSISFGDASVERSKIRDAIHRICQSL